MGRARRPDVEVSISGAEVGPQVFTKGAPECRRYAAQIMVLPTRGLRPGLTSRPPLRGSTDLTISPAMREGANVRSGGLCLSLVNDVRASEYPDGFQQPVRVFRSKIADARLEPQRLKPDFLLWVRTVPLKRYSTRHGIPPPLRGSSPRHHHRMRAHRDCMVCHLRKARLPVHFFQFAEGVGIASNR